MRSIVRIAFALLLAACAGPSLLTAQTARDSAAAAIVGPAVDSSLKHDRQLCKTKNAPKYICASGDTTRLKQASASIAGLLVAPVPIPTPTPTPVPTPSPIDTSMTTFAAVNFDDGTIGNWFDPYKGVLPGEMTVVDDPTSSGHGKVMSLHYYNASAGGWYDNNYAIEPDPSLAAVHATNGDQVQFDGDFYIQRSASTDTINNGYGLRKLNYWCSAEGPSHACYVLATQPSVTAGYITSGAVPDEMLMSSISVANSVNIPCDCQYYGVKVSDSHWHHLTIAIKLNSTNAKKDGGLRIVFDGQTVIDRSDVQWVDPASTTPIDWSDWRIGEQLNSSHQVEETRYWDNLRFAIKRAPVSTATFSLRRPTSAKRQTYPKSFEGPPKFATPEKRIPVRKP